MKMFFYSFSILSPRGMSDWEEWKANRVDGIFVLIGKFGTLCITTR